MSLKSYRDLEVWQKAMDLVEEVYRIAERFPSQEKYGLTGQLQRAAVSIPANIAEGYGRMHRKEYLQHLSIAKGSLAEVETHLALAVRH
jgi:four helix bundle protein